VGIFDSLKNQAANALGQTARSGMGQTVRSAGNAAGQAVSGAVHSMGGKSVSVVFPALPKSRMELSSLPQAAMQTPFDTAALLVAALCLYPENQSESISMINFLKGPQPLSAYETQFIAERMRQNDKAGYIAVSYLDGATPQNNYTPAPPFTVTVSETPNSYGEAGYAMLYLRSGGADSPRPVKLRQAKDNRWYLWEQFLLSDIRKPEASDPWM
jgi:hypothetical protein